MAPNFRAYTRFVALSKHFLLILVAVMIAVVVWIASYNTGEHGARIVFSNIPKSGVLENIMLKPHYQGVDAHNQPFTIIASQATQIDKDNVSLVKIRADMTMGNGAWVALNAGSGHLNLLTKQLDLHDGVELFYDGGYEFRSDHAHVDIQQGGATGDAPVEGQGPPGTLKADSFAITDHGNIIRFNGSVIMTLYP